MARFAAAVGKNARFLRGADGRIGRGADKDVPVPAPGKNAPPNTGAPAMAGKAPTPGRWAKTVTA